MRRLVEIAGGLGLALAASAALALTQAAETMEPSRRPADDPSSAAHVEDAPAPSRPPTIGPAFDADAAMAAHAEPIASYTLKVSLDTDKHDLHGEGRILWKNGSRVAQKELYVHLYLNAFKNDRTLFQRLRTGGFRGGGAATDFGHIEVKKLFIREMSQDVWPTADKTSPGDPEDETDIRVPLPRAVEPNETITMDVEFDEHLPEVTFRTGYAGSFHFVGQWFPKIAKLEPDGRWAHFAFHYLSEFYADYGAYDVTIDTPDRFVVGATGRMESETKKGARVERRFLQEDVHDFAFAAYDEFEELKATSESGVAIRVLYPRGEDKAAALELELAKYGLGYFGAAYGRYPYSTLTIVHPPESGQEAGGMEYPTLITTGSAWYFPPLGVREIEIVTLHELGHQWFYGLVATNEHDSPFLDEGVNSYAEADVMDEKYHESSALRVLGMSFSEDAVFRAEAAEVEADTPVAAPAPDFATGSDYGALVYRRTGTILLTLARVYGADKVRRAVGRYARKYRFGHPGPEELIAAFDEVMGADVAATLRAALFDKATVDFAVEDFASWEDQAPRGIFGDPKKPSDAPKPEAGTWKGSILVRRRGALVFPCDVDLVADDGTTQRITWDAKESAQRLDYRGKSKLVAVVMDPDHKILLDDDLLDNAKRPSIAAISARTLERAAFVLETGLVPFVP